MSSANRRPRVGGWHTGRGPLPERAPWLRSRIISTPTHTASTPGANADDERGARNRRACLSARIGLSERRRDQDATAEGRLFQRRCASHGQEDSLRPRQGDQECARVILAFEGPASSASARRRLADILLQRPAAHQWRRLYLRFAEVDNLQHPPAVQRGQLPMYGRDRRIARFFGTSQFLARPCLMIVSVS